MASSEIIIALGAGGTLVLMTDECFRDPIEILKYVDKKSVNIFFITPSHMNVVLESSKSVMSNISLAKIFNELSIGCAGEAFSVNLFDEMINLGIQRICNLYGPSESGIQTSISLL